MEILCFLLIALGTVFIRVITKYLPLLFSATIITRIVERMLKRTIGDPINELNDTLQEAENKEIDEYKKADLTRENVRIFRDAIHRAQFRP